MSWLIQKIGDITHVVTKGTTPTQKQGFSESGVNFIKAEALNGDSALNQEGIFHISEEVHQKLKRSILQEDDVLLTIAGAQIGKCGFVVSSNLPANTNQAVGVIRVDRSKAIPKYIYYWFKQKRTFSYIQGLNAQAAQPNINLAMLKNLAVPLPAISIQLSISSILSTYDDLLENNRRRIHLLEQAARLLYKEWFVHLRFPGHEHVKIKDGVPGGWQKKPLGELLTLQRGFDLPSSQRKDGFVPIYASTGINGYHVEAKVKAPGVVTGRSGSLGTVMFVSSDFWPLNTTLWVKEFKLVGPYFAAHLLANMQLEQYNGGAAVPTLNRNDVHRVETLCPPPTLLQLFEDYDKDVIQQIEVLKKLTSKLEGARDILLPRLMSGEVAV